MRLKVSEIYEKAFLLGLLLVSCQGLEFTVEPSDIAVPEGTSVLLQCAGRLNEASQQQHQSTKEGKTAPNIRWRGPDGQDIGIVGDTFRTQLTNGSLYISAVDKNRGLTGSYQCLLSVEGIGAIVSRSARVKIIDIPEVNQDSNEIYLYPGQTAYFKCIAEPLSTTKYEIQWLKDDTPLRVDHTRMTLLQSGALEIDEVVPSDRGTYQCNITSGTFVKQSTKANLNIRSPSGLPESFAAPIFVTTPLTQTAREGDTITLDCVANGNPKPHIRWLKSGEEIDLNDLDSRFQIVGTGSLQITAVQTMDTGDYQCRASNSEDSLDASAAVQVQVPPKFTKQPTNRLAYEKDELEFSCAIVGTPTPIIHWLKNGDLIKPNDYMQIVGGSNLRIYGLLSSDAGMFQCIGTNSAGSVQASARLQINETERRQKQKQQRKSQKVANNNGNNKKNKKYLDSSEKQKRLRILSKSSLDSLISNDRRQFNFGAGFDPDTLLDATNDDESNYDDNYEDDDEDDDPGTIHHYGPGTDPKILLKLITENETNVQNFNSNNFLPVTRLPNAAGKGGPLSPLPGAPRDVQAQIVKPHSVTLKWHEPYKNAEEITSYMVFYKQSTSERERKRATTARNVQELNIDNLLPGKIYQIRVVANSNFGLGDTSESIEVRTQPEENIAGPPQNVRAYAVSHTEIAVEWEPPIVTNGVISKFRIYYAEGDSGAELYADSTGTKAVLSELRPFMEYAITVVPWNQNGMGSSSNELIVRTFSSTPSEPPQNISVETTGSTTLMVRWDPPPAEERNGQIVGYKVRYKKLKGPPVTEPTPGNVQHHGIKNLDRMSAYQIRVAAMTVNGSGPYSEWYHAETYESDLDESQVPGKPAFIKTRPGGAMVAASWGVPEGQIMVRGYIIGWGKGIPDEETVTLNDKTRYYEILNLEANCEYVISVRATNNQGDGIPVYDTVRTRQEDIVETPTPLEVPVGLRAIPMSGSSIVLYWTDTTLSKSQLVTDNRFYTVKYSSTGSSRVRYRNTTQLNVMISDLRPNTQYEFAVKVVKSRRESSYSMSVLNTTMQLTPASPPLDLQIKNHDNDPSSVLLTWKEPIEKVSTVTGYIVFYTSDPNKRDRDWIQETVIGNIQMAIIRNLQPETVYYFKVQSSNAKGVGQFSVLAIREIAPVMQARNPLSELPPTAVYIIFGGVLFVILVIVIVGVVLCRKKKPESPEHVKKSYQKTTSGIKPPDLWIHHDQMELKNMEKNPNNATPGSEILPSSGAMTLPRNVHHDYDSQSTLSHITNSLDKRNYVPGYIAAGTLQVNLPMERPGYAQRAQYTLSRPPQISLDSALSQQSLMQQSVNGSIVQTPENPYCYDTLPSNYNNPNVTYAPGLSVDAPKRATSSLKSFAMSGSNGTPINGQKQNLPTVTIRPQNVSPYKKSSATLANSLTLSNRLQTGPHVAHSSDEIQRLQPSNSTEELNQEMANLEGLMKDLSAITASEFEC